MLPHMPTGRRKPTTGPLGAGMFHQPGILMILPSIHRSAAVFESMLVSCDGATPSARPTHSSTGLNLQISARDPSDFGVAHIWSLWSVAAKLPSGFEKQIRSAQDDARSITRASANSESVGLFVDFGMSALIATAVGAFWYSFTPMYGG